MTTSNWFLFLFWIQQKTNQNWKFIFFKFVPSSVFFFNSNKLFQLEQLSNCSTVLVKLEIVYCNIFYFFWRNSMNFCIFLTWKLFFLSFALIEMKLNLCLMHSTNMVMRTSLLLNESTSLDVLWTKFFPTNFFLEINHQKQGINAKAIWSNLICRRKNLCQTIERNF